MTGLENLMAGQHEGMIALRTSIAGNVKGREDLKRAGVSGVNAIAGAQIRTGGNPTVYMR